MKEIFQELIHINTTRDPFKQESRAKELFEKLNTMTLPQHFNWTAEIFEGLHVQQTPDKTALIWMDLDTRSTHSFSYADLAVKANQFVNLLSRSGIQKGSNLYMMTPLIPDSWIASIACIKAGVVNVPTPVTMTQRAMEFRFETYTPDVVMADEPSAEVIDNTLKEMDMTPKLKLITGKRKGWVSLETLDQESDQADAADTKPDDLLFCFFTSGTTGLPKRVGHTAASYPIGHLSTTLLSGIQPDDIHNNLSAPGWSKWSWSSFFAPFNVGATVTGFHFPVLDGEQYLDAISNHQVTSFCAPPTAWRMFVNMNLDSFKFPGLRQALSAGEPLSADIIQKWKHHTTVTIRDYYGQTESTAMIGNPPWMEDQVKPGSFGKPSFMYDMGLSDNETNEITKPDKMGHLVIKLNRWRPIGLFAEYIGSPEKMSAVFVDDYYYTGDRAYFDENGLWWFAGRADDVIKSSDYRIGPFEVESALSEHPSVAETAVIGAPDPYRYQLVKAYIILNPSFKPSRDLALDIFKHAMSILPKFKIPRIVEFIDQIPKTFSGKIRRVELRSLETSRKLQGSDPNDPVDADPVGDTELQEYFYWDFPQLSSKYKS